MPQPLQSNISIYRPLGCPCSAGHGMRCGCPTLRARFVTSLRVYPQDGYFWPSPSPHQAGRMRVGCSEGKCQIQAGHSHAWGTRRRGKTCSAESPGARRCRGAGRRCWQPCRRGRLRRLWQVAASRARGRWGWVGLCLLLLFHLPHPHRTPPWHPFPGHPEQARSCGDARAAGTVPDIPRHIRKDTSSWDLWLWLRTCAVGQGLIFPS